jgi:hypothetical protein
MNGLLLRIGALCTGLIFAAPASAQLVEPASLDPRVAAPSWAFETVGSWWEERARLRQVLGLDPLDGAMLRSPSSRHGGGRREAPFLRVLPLDITITRNTAIPFGGNEDVLVPGRGAAERMSFGIAAGIGPLRMTFAPQVMRASNLEWHPLDSAIWFPPAQELAGWTRFAIPHNASPWIAPGGTRTPYFLDLPMQYGSAQISRSVAGQSAIWLEAGGLAAGYGTENQWWGPGIRNALLLSNNAPGVPAAFVRSVRPLDTPVGAFEWRYLLGSLQESGVTRVDTLQGRRSMSSAALEWRPRGVPGLSVGVARMVIKDLDADEPVSRRWRDVLLPVGRPNAKPLTDTLAVRGRDQLTSAFFRYVAPAAGVEVYGEFGRAEETAGLRDWLAEPNHSLGSTLGLQWVRPVGNGLLRVQWERTALEQAPTYLNRPSGSWYTSRAVQAGFTHQGQVLGATIGPGSSSQFVAVDLLRRDWRLGAFFGRHRFNADAFNTMPWPLGTGYCEYDTSLYPGMRGAFAAARGLVSWSATYVARLNTFFQNATGCPGPEKPLANDRFGWSFALRFTPPMPTTDLDAAAPTRGEPRARTRGRDVTAPGARDAAAVARTGGRLTAETFAGSEAESYLRVLQSVGKVPRYPWGIRRFTPREVRALSPRDGDHPWAARFNGGTTGLMAVRPSVGVRWNSAYPTGDNDGAVWAGRGATAVVSGGAAWNSDRLSVTVAPVGFRASNGEFPLLPATVNAPFGNDFNDAIIDLPQRMGALPYARWDGGQSSVDLTALGITASLSTANEAWGPAQRYPVVLGVNAAGIPGLRIGTASPWDLGLARVHVRALYGEASQSPWFRVTPNPDDFGALLWRRRRFVASAAVVVMPRGLDGLELGATRFTHVPWPDSGLVGRYWSRPFGGALKTRLPAQNGVAGGDQWFDGDNSVASVFARWVFPSSGLEVYAEFGREDYPWDLRYVAVVPDEQSAVLYGLRKTFQRERGTLVVARAELLNYQQHNVDRARGRSPWYLSSAGAVQGHTQFGQLLAAPLSAGRGAGGEFAIDVYQTTGRWTGYWRRDVQRQLAGTGPDGLGNPNATEARHALGLERLAFRGRTEVLLGVEGSVSVHRYFRNADQGNLALWARITRPWW